MDTVKSKTVCFTGHRPEKLPDGGDPMSPRIRIIKSMLYAEIVNAVSDGFDTFFTGMQRGIDLWGGEIVLSLAAEKGLKLVAVLPHRDIGKSFKGEEKWIFGRISSNADKLVIISDSYTRSCFFERNRFMVDNSSRVIAVIGSEKSGTGQTLRYARSKGLDVRKIDLKTLFPDG